MFYFSPSVDRSTKPVDHFLDTGVSGTNKYSLKDVAIPRDVVVKFLSVAEPNTKRNAETCGILAGKMVRPEPGCNFITKVLPSVLIQIIAEQFQ